MTTSRQPQESDRTEAPPLPEWIARHDGDPIYEWARSAWRRAASAPGAWFDAAKADKVIERWPHIFRLTDDRFAGVPFRLLPWQEITVRLLVGWKRSTEIIDPQSHKMTTVFVRVFRRLDLWIPRKNGKSEFLAALGVLFFALERVPGGQGYVFARDEKQALVPFRKMKGIISAANGLHFDRAGNERIMLSAKSIYVRETSALCQLVTGSDKGKHGTSPTVILGDEIHEWRSREVADTLRQGTGTRLQPIELYASTAGRKQDRIGFEWFEESLAILDGDQADTSTLVVYFGIGEEDDWTDEDVWRRANPSIGLTPTWDYLRGEYAKAKGRPAEEAKFQCYHLNKWVDQISGWLAPSKWRACVGPESWKTLLETNRGRRAFLACDVSSSRDLTALVAVLPPDDDHRKWIIVPRFWVPEGTLDQRAAEDRRLKWRDLVESGALHVTPGDSVDQNFVMRAIQEDCDHFDVAAFGFDPWNARKLAGDLQHEGMDAELQVEMRQGPQTLGGPTKEFERLVFAEKVEHGGHPLLSWMAGHCTVRFDVNLNYVPDKKSSKDKIDGIVAAVMGVGLAMSFEDDGPSVYEERGILML